MEEHTFTRPMSDSYFRMKALEVFVLQEFEKVSRVLDEFDRRAKTDEILENCDYRSWDELLTQYRLLSMIKAYF